MASLLMDIITEILLRLPPECLLRFRCVSKSWCGLIDSPSFIKMHLRRSTENNSNLSIILKDMELYSVDFELLDGAKKLDHHPLKNSCTTNVLGSCNGLLLLGNIERGMAIWNYSTRKFRKLPESAIQPPIYDKYFRYAMYGFGYDSMTDDYKVLRIIQFYCEEKDCFSSEVKVYSLKSNSWRRIQNFPYYLCFSLGWGGVYASGALHWVVKEKRDPDMPKLIASFDFGSEEYRVVLQPEYNDGCFQMGLEVLGGCLCVTCSYFKDRLDIWLMKEYAVKESWTKLLTIVPPNIRTFEYVKPLSYSKGGGEILMDYDDKKLLWYDLDGKLVKEVCVQGMPHSFNAEVCVGSLVPIDGYPPVDGEPKQGQDKDMKKRDDMGDFLSHGFKLVL